MFRAILFDVGGPIDTEVEYERLIDQHIIEALRDEGLPVSLDQVRAASDWAVNAYADQTYAAMIWKLTDGDRSAAARALEAVNARSEERERLRGGLELRDGIGDLIERSARSGVVLGLAANQPVRVLGELKKHGLARHFSSREVSGVHGYRKPDVRLFLRACETLDVAPAECVMVGDRIDNDVSPAAALGMRTILLRTGRHIHQQPRSAAEVPDSEVTTVGDIAEALDALFDPRSPIATA